MRLIRMIALPHDLRLHDRIRRRGHGTLRIASLQLGEHVHAFNHAAKAGVLAVETGRLLEGEKELRAARLHAAFGPWRDTEWAG
jgi:hypothetical protein